MKFCPQCGSPLQDGARFCGECGAPLDGSGNVSQSVAKGNRGTVIQAAAGSTVHHGLESPKNIPLKARWTWNSPLTQSALAWIGTVLSLLTLLPLAKIAEPLWALLRGSAPSVTPSWERFVWMGFFLVVAVLAALSWSAFNVVRKRQVRPLDRLGLFPAAWGRDGRLGLARMEGECPQCDGALRLKNIATMFKIDTDGNERPTKWEPFAVCRKNPEQHRFAFDVTATIDAATDEAS